jgi:hypothetical protein
VCNSKISCTFAKKYRKINIMQTAHLKYDIISWITGLNDEKVIQKLHQWIEKQETVKVSTERKVSSKQNGSLTKGFGIWADDAPFNETNYRDQLWQTEKNIW